MLAVKNLERLMEIEADLKAQWEAKLAARDAEIEKVGQLKEKLEAKLEKQRNTLAEQQQKITELSAAASDTSRIEQLNRELDSRAARLQEEAAAQKKRIKTLQRELAAEREELKSLKQFDAQKLKKNLDANKKKLAENISANDLLQKSNNKLKKEVEEMRARLKTLESTVESETGDEAGDAPGKDQPGKKKTSSKKRAAQTSQSGEEKLAATA
ncbi:MAG: hypothetical protein WBN40_13470 [Pseudomonadales bacterium]